MSLAFASNTMLLSHARLFFFAMNIIKFYSICFQFFQFLCECDQVNDDQYCLASTKKVQNTVFDQLTSLLSSYIIHMINLIHFFTNNVSNLWSVAQLIGPEGVYNVDGYH